MKEYKEIHDLHNLDMHEKMVIRKGFYVTRVPGGWIYESSTKGTSGFTNDNYQMATTFVPYSDERIQHDEPM
jgi:hypothetical protein